eukprot:jgi/Hompol1/6419/HPOL_002262-RA
MLGSLPFPTIDEQAGILGVIEMLIVSDESLRDKMLPPCLQNLDFLNHLNLIVLDDSDDEHRILSEMDTFASKVIAGLLRLTRAHRSLRDQISQCIWNWCSNLLVQITAKAHPFHIHLAVAALIGIVRSFNSEAIDDSLSDIVSIKSFVEQALSLDKIRIISQSWDLSPRDMTVPPPTPSTEYTILKWIRALLTGLRDLLAGSLDLEGFNSNSFSEVWADLTKTRANSSHIDNQANVEFEDVIIAIYSRCWCPDWRQTILRHSSADQDGLSEICTLVVHVCVLCSVHVPSIQPGLIKDLLHILDEVPTVLDSISLDVYLATIGGLEILAMSHQDSAAQITDTLYSSQRKTTLYTFTNTLHSTYQQVTAATAPKSDIGRRYQNAIAAIGSLCSALKPKETIDVAIPALARRLDDGQTLFDDFIWKNLGNIGLTHDTDVFRQIVTFIIDYIADDNQNPALIRELRDIMSIVRVICEQEAFRPQFLASTNPELVNSFRNVWFYLVLYVWTPTGSWPKEWIGLLKVIASKTPPLILDKQHRSLEANLGANSILQGSLPESITTRVKAQLTALLPMRALEIKIMSIASSVYLLAVYHIESIRIRAMSVDFICRYLTDERLYSTEIYASLESIADEVLKLFLRDQTVKQGDVHVVEHNMQCLMLYAAHRLAKARRFAVKWILNIVDIVPMMLWNQTVAFLMMDIIRYLDSHKMGLSDDGFKNPLLSKLFFLNKQEAQAASKDYLQVAELWLRMAVQRSAPETVGVVQTYLVAISNKSPYTSLDDHSDLMVLLTRFSTHSEIISTIFKSPSKHSRYLGEIKGMIFAYNQTSPELEHDAILKLISTHLKTQLLKTFRTVSEPNFAQRLNHAVFRCAGLIVTNDKVEAELIKLVCFVPNISFDPTIMEIVVAAWTWILISRPDLSKHILTNLIHVWELTALSGQGLYGVEMKSSDPFQERMTYGPPQPTPQTVNRAMSHTIWIRFFIERFSADRLRGQDHLQLYTQLFEVAAQFNSELRFNWTTREARFDLALLGLEIARELESKSHRLTPNMWTHVFDIALGWFEHAPVKLSSWTNSRSTRILLNAIGDTDRVELADVQSLLIVLLEHEIARLATWTKPLESDPDLALPQPPNERLIKWPQLVRLAWSLNPIVAIQLRARFINSADSIEVEIADISRHNEITCLRSPEAAHLFLKNSWRHRSDDSLRFLLYWAPVPPIQAISMLSQSARSKPWILQYAVRVLEFFPVEQVFFFIPQMVQALRDDSAGKILEFGRYIERFILEAARSSQLFAHQIIWNMNANMYKDESCEVPDSIKPCLDRIIAKIIADLSGSDKAFYEREFGFFAQVTGISGTLKPLVQADASKAEKKVSCMTVRIAKKIDEEMRKISVEVGVYLPTNPESTVIDIDYDSGRPLQSHAKAPFMATFRVNDALNNGSSRWMSSIFKVGDDCRQDVLALQLISIFKSIFVSAGLDLYVFPYRVVATAPGCGVIEVLPRSISRDQMGREKVNSLYDWFIAEFGPEDSVEYQKARTEFVKSLAAYSLIMFILQIKDRHNGNIMFDKDGHMIHIDFGFILSIAPGGGILEVSPFKLTAEMVQVMGGDVTSPAYILFSELCIKAYLACRPYAEEIISMVALMMESGLPCFKGEVTIRKLRERFQLDKSERAAAEFMINCIRQSHENTRSGLYDTFQYLQNGIPYRS